MWLFKKSTESRQSPQQPISLGIPTPSTNADLAPDIGPEAVNDRRGSRVVFRDRSEDRRLHASDASTQAHRREDAATLLREREHEREVPSNTPNERPSRDAPDLSSAESQSEVQNRVEREDRGTVTEQPPERISEDDHIGKGVHDTVQLGGSGVVERFNPLKVVLGTISAAYINHKETVAVRDKIEDLLSRIEALEARFATPPGNIVEQKRRREVIRKLGCIEGQLRSLSEKHGLRRLDEHIQGDDVSGLLEDIRETISDYQMAQQTATYEQACKLISTAEASVLNNFRCAQKVEYRHGDRRGCLKGTRTAVLDQIELWTRGFDKPPVYWLNGLAGTGKSTIAQTIAERIFADGQLGASFFCSRDFEDRRDLRFIFPTIAVQLARKYTEFRSIFVPLVQSYPAIVDESLYNQVKKLIVEPLKRSAISTVIVIDALDECKDKEPASAILTVLGQFVSEIPKTKFFLTGRPEPQIRRGFGLSPLAEATDMFVLHEVEPSRVDSDIRLFLRHSFLEIVGRRGGLGGWPTEEQLNLLCERAAGLFVYAVATVKFIDHRNKNPTKQLDHLLLLPKSTVYEGKIKFKENTTLDSLYTSILQEAFGDDDPEDDPMVRSVLGAVVLAANPLSPSTIGALLGFDTEDVIPLLSSVHSLLTLQENTDQPVRPFHKSFPDFIVDPTRCINQRFRVFPPNHHLGLLIGCLNLMNKSLEKNMCKLPDAVTNSQVPDLRERIEQDIDPALQYACKSWHKHLVDEHTARTPEITSALHRFLENKFVFWLEVLSILGAAREAIDALDVVTKRLEASSTVELANDCFRFVTGFFEVIEESAPHIYHSALPLSPRKSMVRKLYERHANPMARVVRGLPDSWDPAIVTLQYSCSTAAWSPCGRFIAISDGGSTAEIRDAATLKRLTVLESLGGYIHKLVFSPDARLLMSCTYRPEKLISWDLQTGVMVSAISPEQWGDDTECHAITYSACGTMFGVLISRLGTFTIRTYNVHSGTHTHSHPIEGKAIGDIWTHGGCLRFATIKPGSITTWEVGFASRNPPTEIESLPLPNNFFHDSSVHAFHPTLSRLAFKHLKRIFVWDAQRSKFLLNERDQYSYGASFSSDGRFFMDGTSPSTIYLWKPSTGYVFHRKLSHETLLGISLMSPNGESIFTFSSRVIQLSHTMDSITSSCNRSYGSFSIGFFPDEMLAAVARILDFTITVFDLTSGDPLLTINAGVLVVDLRAAGNTVVVLGEEHVVTCNLPAQGRVLDPKANVKNSIRTATIRCPGITIVSPVSISPDLHRVAFAQDTSLHLHDVPTGRCLVSVPIDMKFYSDSWFTPDGCQVWYITHEGEADGFTIVEGSKSGVIKLEHLESTDQPPITPPWLSSCGYQITDDGWILGIAVECNS
ncbi:hypothetical protein BDM02DRAFT_3273353 [Thelephora ganbajun]|uniref:Uncharacterized protein n=1 Tax=Thelephora ganbajun TaxID=370292 RepID=A0ACB6YZJ7_THEGA|nr:hypothetical protein BDM02DRAFT_3273353 [Thelephora ganbajun]